MRYRALGPLAVSGPAGELPLGGPLRRAVLAYLLLHANQVMPVARIVDEVWGASPPATAPAQVQAHISRLRRLLAEPGSPPAPAGRATGPIETRPTGYLFTLPPDQFDLTLFERRIADARALLGRVPAQGVPNPAAGPDVGAGTPGERPPSPATGPLRAAGELLRSALALWRGTPLDGVEARFAELAADRLTALRLAAVEYRIGVDLRLGQGAELVPELTDLVEQHPLREGMRGQLMLALHRAGRRAEALRVFQQGYRLLRDELGLQPSDELARMNAAVLRDDARLGPPAWGSEPGRSGGRWAPRRSPPADPPPAQLPPQVGPFVGRVRESALCDRAGRVPGAAPVPGTVVLSGPPGIGKTALATRWAHRIADRFPDGQLFLDLQPDGIPLSPAEALGQLLESLGVPAVPAGLPARANLYRTLLAARRRTLIVGDGATGSAQVLPLVPAAPGVLLVLTTRHRLDGLATRHQVGVVPVGPLPSEDAIELLRRVIGDRRVRREHQAAARLVDLCGGVPLAVRVLAARLAVDRWTSLGELAREIGDGRSLDPFEVEGANPVRSAVRAAYGRLDPASARLFRLLHELPVTGFDRAAAARLAGAGEAGAKRPLERLADVHLLRQVRAGWYVVPPLVRLWADEQRLRGGTAAVVGGAGTGGAVISGAVTGGPMARS